MCPTLLDFLGELKRERVIGYIPNVYTIIDFDCCPLSWRGGYVTLLSPACMMAVIQWNFMGHKWGI
jgi:hypothetical protein